MPWLDTIPSENSGVVKAEREKLLGVIDLRALVSDLGRVGGFIRIEYNGVGAAGYEYTKEQIEIQRLGYDITRLCDKSALTVARFKNASSSIVTDLQCTYIASYIAIATVQHTCSYMQCHYVAS